MNSSLKPDSINTNHQIIDSERYNGRINIVSQPSTDVVFKMQ